MMTQLSCESPAPRCWLLSPKAVHKPPICIGLPHQRQKQEPQALFGFSAVCDLGLELAFLSLLQDWKYSIPTKRFLVKACSLESCGVLWRHQDWKWSPSYETRLDQTWMSSDFHGIQTESHRSIQDSNTFTTTNLVNHHSLPTFPQTRKPENNRIGEKSKKKKKSSVR